MSAEEQLAALKEEVAGLKLALVKKEEEVEKTAENVGLVEGQLKKLLQQTTNEGVKREGIVYVTVT